MMLDSMRDTLLCFCQDVGGAKIRVKLCAPPITYFLFECGVEDGRSREPWDLPQHDLLRF
jgi:hypothetical protein